LSVKEKTFLRQSEIPLTEKRQYLEGRIAYECLRFHVPETLAGEVHCLQLALSQEGFLIDNADVVPGCIQLYKRFSNEPFCLRLSQVGDDVAVGERERTELTTFLPVLSRLSFVDWVTGGERQRGGKLTEFSWWLLKPQAVTLLLVYVDFCTREILVWSARPV
jgi:hypothetical protein